MRDFLARLLATFAFIGHLPLAPGTWASAVTLILWVVLAPHHSALAIPVLAIVFLGGTWAAHRCERLFGHDDGRVVIDEVAGSLIAVAWIAPGIGAAAGGFVLFRIFDIVKPPPIYQIQALRGGFGVMADDVLAGLAANLCLRLLAALVGQPGGVGG